MHRADSAAPDAGENHVDQLLSEWRLTDERWGELARASQEAAGVVRHYPGGAHASHEDLAAQVRASVTWRVGAAVLAPVRGLRRLLARGDGR